MIRLSRVLFVAGFIFSLALAITVSGAQQKKTAPAKKTAGPSEARLKAEETYRTTCIVCHGADGNAPIKDMNLADGEWKHGSTTVAIAQTITNGVPGTAMLPFKDKFSKAEIAELARLVRSFSAAKKAPAQKKQ